MSDFDLDGPPFDLLTADELQRLQRGVDLVYFDKGARPIREGERSASVFVVHRGHMQAIRDGRDGEERLGEYGPGDVLGAFAVMMGQARFTYEALEQTLCLSVPAADFSHAMRDNPRFAAWFLEGLGAKHQLLAEGSGGSDLAELMLTRVADAQLAPALRVDAGTSLGEARRRMKAHRVSCVLVDTADGGTGIVTRTDLLDALALDGQPPTAAIAPLVRSPLIGVRHDEVLFSALVSMTEHHVERVVVLRDHQPIGTLGMTEVLSHYSSHSHLIGLQLARAESFDDIRTAARRINGLVRTLHAQGARIGFLMELVSALNARVMASLFERLVPAEHRQRMCLLVLGSEGRREQIIKTDQDNALIVDDDLDWPGLPAAMARFSEEVAACGWPPCPGGVMVSQPQWRHAASDWRRRIDGWAGSSDPRDMLDFAITFDARPIAGNPKLLADLEPAFASAARNDVVLHHFARAALQFPTPLTLFRQVRAGERGTNIKKGGVFPLVHGLRTLALACGVDERNSFRRADGVVAAGGLSEALGRDVHQALEVFQRLRLRRQLEVLRAGGEPDNYLHVDQLSRLDRELLRDALLIVDEFKGVLQRRFHL
jgi:CBS domain-containing protein